MEQRCVWKKMHSGSAVTETIFLYEIEQSQAVLLKS